MNFSPIEGVGESKKAYQELKKRLTEGAEKLKRNVGWPGGNGTFDVYWHERHGFWVAFDPNLESRYWCAFGTKDPGTQDRLKISCEINPPKRGIDRRCAGMFLKDAASRIYLAHTGKIGGGRKGVGKTEFLSRLLPGERELVEWSDGGESEVVWFGRIASPQFLRQIGSFLREVASFKAAVREEAPSDIEAKNPGLGFSPEFSGQRKRYRHRDEIDSRCDHGTVVNCLQSVLQGRGYQAHNTQSIDLFLVDSKSRMTHLFEVKTDQNTSSLYQAVGQVMLHGALHERKVNRIVVMPGKASEETLQKLGLLGIHLLEYEWQGEQPAFPGLEFLL